ncbi:MAG: acyl-CoA dehydrogenase [Gammaproteobacteria bacterium]|nr:acyl-CoA dehydrogenase [Gammaproteobacteria bacterium]
MSDYVAPLKEMRFVVERLCGLEAFAAIPEFADTTSDLVEAVLSEAARLANEVIAPLNRLGDTHGVRLEGDVAHTAPGWREAYRAFVDGGWNGLSCDPEFGGQGLPKLVATAVSEMWNSANLSFALGPMLTQGAVDAIENHAADELKARYLPNMISGEWTGTMNLTEPQAGSDLSAVRARAVPEGDHFRITGQKIFITYGEHDLTANIIHLVLARLPDAPAGTRGISLFVVPKFLLKDDGTPGERNDVRCVSLEHKLGIHGSPTAVMSFGEKGGAIGYLVGEPNRGLEYMFTMMNAARHGVGVEGMALGERAYQRAVKFARERVQGKPVGYAGKAGAIIEHPDVRRMLMTMRAYNEAMRVLTYACGMAFDLGAKHPDAVVRDAARRRGDLLTPIVKGWCTETGNLVTSLGVQVHGGMGFIEETGAAQHFRDARITTIYEGTTGIQAADLVGRKTLRDGGHAARELLAEMRADVTGLAANAEPRVAQIAASLEAGIAAIERVLRWLLSAQSEDPRLPLAASAQYLELWGVVAGGWLLARGAAIAADELAAGSADPTFFEGKLATAHYYALQILPQARALEPMITAGAAATYSLEADAL